MNPTKSLENDYCDQTAGSCDRKADGLIDYVRELKDDQLSEEEKKLNRPWIDLIVFMVDCQ